MVKLVVLVAISIACLIFCSAQDCSTVDVQNILLHLRELDRIATSNNGNRAAGSSGYQASLGYVVSKLATTNFQVKLQDFTFTTFKVIGTPSFAQTAPVVKSYAYQTEFRVMPGSGTGDVSGSTYAVPNLGCSSIDYAKFPVGAVAVVSRGTCTFTEKAALAATARASAIIIYNNNQGPVFSGTCETSLPAYGVSAFLGLELTEQSVSLTIDVETLKEVSITSNIIADTFGGDPNNIVVVGSHLDGVTAGPGINDNGSGTSTNLEIALTVNRCLPNPRNKIRFAWWGAEELGLLGSRYYVDDLKTNNPDELKKIALNLNFDMIASPNFFYGVYNGSGAAPEIREKCVLIQREFEASITSQGKPFSLTPFSGRSDYGPFIENGIPAGGLFSGAEEVKNSDGRSIFKGLANTAYDPCYHDYCDSYENLSAESLTTLAKSAYTVTTRLANTVFKPESNSFRGSKIFPIDYHPDAISPY
jgi:Zn-dependent M28 family amino/carboxypeptidase